MSFILFTVFSFSQDPFCETVVIQGQSSVKQTPELVAFFIEFTVLDTNFEQCANLALQKIKSVKSQFIENDLEEELVKTINYSISEENRHDSRSGQQIFIGYRAHIPLSIKTNVSDPNASKIFELIKSNFKSNFRINFELSENQIENIKEKLIELAVQDATSKAEILAKNLNVKLGRISKIQYGDPQMVRDFTRSNYNLISSVQLMSEIIKADINTLTPVEIEMRTSVMLAWEIIY
jgi:uncharacterized protein YggE